MGWLITLNFSTLPTFASYRGLQPKPAAHTVSNLWCRRESLRVISSTCIDQCATTQILDPDNLICLPIRGNFFRLPFHADVSYYPQTLTGFWVGPDSEDDWGFVEAFIDEIV